TVTKLFVRANGAAADGSVVDWDAFDQTQFKDLTHDVSVAVGGNVTLTIDSVVLIAGSFTLSQSSTSLSVYASPSAAAGTGVDTPVSLLLVSLTADVFAGVGGQLATDGGVDPDQGIGFLADNVSVTLGLASTSDGTRSWSGLSFAADQAGL